MQVRPNGLSERLEALIAKLPEEKRSSLRELLSSLLEPADKLQEQRDSLERLEHKYVLALEEDSKNVLGFRRIEKLEPQLPLKSDRRWALRVPCLIEAASFGEIFRMAFELHLRSSKSIFLSWQDIDPLGRKHSETLLELHTCTIFIPEVTALSNEEQTAVLEVLRYAGSDRPHIMAGTQLPYAELLRAGSLQSDVIEALSEAYLKLTKPVSEYKREGLIRYFLESLS
jgi:hypothetical protein